MEYEILKQDEFDERTFTLKDTETGETFSVDIYTDGKIEYPTGVDETAESWKKWLSTFVGKKIFIERITPCKYFSGGETRILD